MFMMTPSLDQICEVPPGGGRLAFHFDARYFNYEVGLSEPISRVQVSRDIATMLEP
jgi:hypothetical protein